MRIQPRFATGSYSTAILLVFRASIGPTSSAFVPALSSFNTGSSSSTRFHSSAAHYSFQRFATNSADQPPPQSNQNSNLDSLRVPELKDLLRSANLKVGGRKAELIDRLQSHYASSTSTTTSSSRSDSTLASNNKMTDAESSAVTHAPESMVPDWFNSERTRLLTPNASTPKSKSNAKGDCIIYWMQRDMRTVDNWALLFATHQAQQCQVPLRVVYALPPSPPSAAAASDALPPLVVDMPMTKRHGSFLLEGLKVVESELAEKDVQLEVLYPADRSQVGQCVHNYATQPNTRALAVICDFSPLRLSRMYMEDQAAPLFDSDGVPMYSVDAHNIVPVWHASPKREVGARTLRPKINKLLPEFLTHFADFEGNAHIDGAAKIAKVDWSKVEKYLNMDDAVPACDWAQAGHEAAMARFEEFCSSKKGNGLKNFDTARNDPNYSDVCSNLSPWINYGQVSFQRLALDVRALKKYSGGTAAYIEEGVVRRELSDNFVYYTRDAYDSLDAAAGWARDSLNLHESDDREYVYSLEEFDKGQTHDDLWNAAQLQLTKEGGMHGFLRMYWAKKILEWTPNAATALRTGLYFNDRYALDGNDPNGFVGVGWSVMGIHDMGWKERPIFGKIRFMNYAGCKRKFKVPDFVRKYKEAYDNSIAAAKKHGGQPAAGAASKKKAATKKGTKRKAA